MWILLFFSQLLAATLQVEKPELELRRTELLRLEEDLKVQLVTLEDELLTTLAESQGNILENKVIFWGLERINDISMGKMDLKFDHAMN